MPKKLPLHTALAIALCASAMTAHAIDFQRVINQATRWKSSNGEANQEEHVDVSLPPSGNGFDGCSENFANHTPPLLQDEAQRRAHRLCFDGFAVLYSGVTKTPVYAAEVLSKSRLLAAKAQRRTNLFFPDQRVPHKERSSLEDYRGSGFDRGHNAPSADQGTPEGVAQSFALSNMMPQAAKNNQGPWADIEQSTRKYVLRAKGNVFVVTGSVLLPGACHYPNLPRCQIGRGVTVPSHLFKLVYDPNSGRAWAHWIENTDSATVSKPITYEQLIKLTGIEFLPGIRPLS